MKHRPHYPHAKKAIAYLATALINDQRIIFY